MGREYRNFSCIELGAIVSTCAEKEQEEKSLVMGNDPPTVMDADECALL